MVPIDLLQHDYPWALQLRGSGAMGGNELPGRWWSCISPIGECSKCLNVLPHGGLLLFLGRDSTLHWHQGSFDIWNVSPTHYTLCLRLSVLMLQSLGYAPYAAGLYTNNRYGVDWFVLLGAALCGISAGVFWMAEAAIAIAYPEPWNKGKALGYWLTYRLAGQILGGAINLGLNAQRNEAGKVSYTVYEIFIALQAAGPLIAMFLNRPSKVERRDGKSVSLSITLNPWKEIRRTTKDFFSKRFLLILLWIGQVVFAEAVFFTYLASQSLPNPSTGVGYS